MNEKQQQLTNKAKQMVAYMEKKASMTPTMLKVAVADTPCRCYNTPFLEVLL